MVPLGFRKAKCWNVYNFIDLISFLQTPSSCEWNVDMLFTFLQSTYLVVFAEGRATYSCDSDAQPTAHLVISCNQRSAWFFLGSSSPICLLLWRSNQLLHQRQSSKSTGHFRLSVRERWAPPSVPCAIYKRMTSPWSWPVWNMTSGINHLYIRFYIR